MNLHHKWKITNVTLRALSQHKRWQSEGYCPCWISRRAKISLVKSSKVILIDNSLIIHSSFDTLLPGNEMQRITTKQPWRPCLPDFLDSISGKLVKIISSVNEVVLVSKTLRNMNELIGNCLLHFKILSGLSASTIRTPKQ